MYTHKKIFDDTTLIIDEYKESIYLIEGTQQALLIDTGMDQESLYEYVCRLTDKPVTVVLTHGHIDHTGQTYEFENVYLDMNDIPTYITHMSLQEGHFDSSKCAFKAPSDLLEMDKFFDLGNKDILVLPLSGHTPGSVIFIDASNKAIYTGDAIGSGCGVWMQLDESTDILMYKNSLEKAYDALKRIGVDDSWSFNGGHYGQENESKVSDYNPLTLHLMSDMITLCEKLLLDEVEYKPTKALSQKYESWYVSYHTAEMITCKEKVNKLS